MLQGAFSDRSRGTAKDKGFSLTELAFSVLLIAAIAVLSFPTVQGFTPISDRQARSSQPFAVAQQAASVSADDAQPVQEEFSTALHQERSNSQDSASGSADNRADQAQGGNGK